MWFSVTVPITGIVCREVEAASEQEAIDMVIDAVDFGDDLPDGVQRIECIASIDPEGDGADAVAVEVGENHGPDEDEESEDGE